MQPECMDKDANSNTADGDGWTALMGAAIEGEKEMVELLLAHGANPYAEDTCGGTAYQYAKSMGHLEVIRLLPDPNAVKMRQWIGVGKHLEDFREESKKERW